MSVHSMHANQAIGFVPFCTRLGDSNVIVEVVRTLKVAEDLGIDAHFIVRASWDNRRLLDVRTLRESRGAVKLERDCPNCGKKNIGQVSRLRGHEAQGELALGSTWVCDNPGCCRHLAKIDRFRGRVTVSYRGDDYTFRVSDVLRVA